MSRSNQPEDSSKDRSLVHRSSREVSQRASRRSDDGPEVKQSKSDKNTSKRLTRKQHVPPTTYLPTAEELDRMERMMALQERLENLKKIRVQGHTYGKLTVSGNARAIRGNLTEESAFPSYSRSHTYGDCEVRDDGMVWNGDISVGAFKDSRKNPM